MFVEIGQFEGQKEHSKYSAFVDNVAEEETKDKITQSYITESIAGIKDA